MKTFEIAATLIDKKGNLKNVRKAFKTEAARAKWVEKQEDAGNLYSVDGYREEE